MTALTFEYGDELAEFDIEDLVLNDLPFVEAVSAHRIGFGPGGQRRFAEGENVTHDRQSSRRSATVDIILQRLTTATVVPPILGGTLLLT
jgi:hypothetical protein